jgi:hypothetical protein
MSQVTVTFTVDNTLSPLDDAALLEAVSEAAARQLLMSRDSVGASIRGLAYSVQIADAAAPDSE